SIGGAISGAAGMRGMQDLDQTLRLVGAGAGVLLVLWLVPSGLAGLVAKVRDRCVAPLARRNGLDATGQPLTQLPGDSAALDLVELEATGAGAIGPTGSDSEVVSGGSSVDGEFEGDVLDVGSGLALQANGVKVSYGRLQVL